MVFHFKHFPGGETKYQYTKNGDGKLKKQPFQALKAP